VEHKKLYDVPIEGFREEADGGGGGRCEWTGPYELKKSLFMDFWLGRSGAAEVLMNLLIRRDDEKGG